MTDAQKTFAVTGLVILAVTTFFAPYDIVAFDSVAQALGRDPRLSEVVHAPIWDAPTPEEVRAETGRTFMTEIRSIELAAGRMGLWWAGILVFTVGAIALASPSTEKPREPDAEPERRTEPQSLGVPPAPPKRKRREFPR